MGVEQTWSNCNSNDYMFHSNSESHFKVIVTVIIDKVIVIHYYFVITFCQTHNTFCQICHWTVKSHCHLIGCSFIILFIIDSVTEKTEMLVLLVLLFIYKFPSLQVHPPVSSGGLVVNHPALCANGHRFKPRKSWKLFQILISRLTTSWVADHVKWRCRLHLII